MPRGAAREGATQGDILGMDIEAEPEIQKKNLSKNNSTTKSLILAQDER